MSRFVQSCQCAANAEGNFERGGRLLLENVKDFERGKGLRIACPTQFLALTQAEHAVPIGSDANHSGLDVRRGIAFGKQAIAIAQQ